MKASKTLIGILNLTIFLTLVALGALTGYSTGDFRIGTHLGIGLGMMGIIVFGYLREKAGDVTAESAVRTETYKQPGKK